MYYNYKTMQLNGLVGFIWKSIQTRYG